MKHELHLTPSWQLFILLVERDNQRRLYSAVRRQFRSPDSRGGER